MNVLFANRMERAAKTGGTEAARVCIRESQGMLSVHWVWEPGPQGEEGKPEETWYRGESWEEMLALFRYRVMEKMGEGFVPVIGHIPERPDRLSTSARFIQQLFYYSERHADEKLYEELRAWRKKRAAEDGKAPYIVATNRMLKLISAFKPKSGEELLQIPGFGNNKMEWYGEEILAMTKLSARETSFPLTWVADAIDEADFLAWLFRQKEEKYKQEAEDISRKMVLLKGMQAGLGLRELSAKVSLPVRDVVLMLERLEREGYEFGAWVKAELRRLPQTEVEKALDAFRRLGVRYLKPVMEEVYSDAAETDDPEEIYIRLRLIRLHARGQTETAA